MRLSTLLVLTALVLLVVFVGFWKTVGYLLAGVLLFILLVFGALFVGILLLRRRMHRKMAEFRQAFEKAQAEAVAQQSHQRMKREAIDTEFSAGDGTQGGPGDRRSPGGGSGAGGSAPRRAAEGRPSGRPDSRSIDADFKPKE